MKQKSLKFPLIVGNNVTVGHGAILHGCTIEDNCLIGMGAGILDGAQVGSYSMVAAGSVVREGRRIPEKTLVAGVPAEPKRTVTPEEIASIEQLAEHYVTYLKEYKKSRQS